MREEKMKETLERVDFFIEITATSDTQKPEVLIRPRADTSTQTTVRIYKNLPELTDALVKLGLDRRDVESGLKQIYTAYAPVEDVSTAGKSVSYTVSNITLAQARDFGWKDFDQED